jgi:hypothetical protein
MLLTAALVGGVIGGVIGAAIAPITSPILMTVFYLSKPATIELGKAAIKLGAVLRNAFTTTTKVLWQS